MLKWTTGTSHGQKQWEATCKGMTLRISANTPGYTLRVRGIGSGTLGWRRSLIAETLRECKARANHIASALT
jgi:hypothetical protein